MWCDLDTWHKMPLKLIGEQGRQQECQKEEQQEDK